MKVEILGDGCSKCKALKHNVQQAVAELGIPAEIRSVMNPERIAELQALSLPQLVVDGQLIRRGDLTSLRSVKELFQQLATDAP